MGAFGLGETEMLTRMDSRPCFLSEREMLTTIFHLIFDHISILLRFSESIRIGRFPVTRVDSLTE